MRTFCMLECVRFAPFFADLQEPELCKNHQTFIITYNTINVKVKSDTFYHMLNIVLF